MRFIARVDNQSAPSALAGPRPQWQPRALEPLRSRTVQSFSIAGRCLPAGMGDEPIAGDFFDVYPLDMSRLLIAVGDVAGHGPSAAERMQHLREWTRTVARDADSPAAMLAELDRLQVSLNTDDIATMWLGMYDSRTGLLRYASAGHPPPVLAEPGRRAELLREASAPPLGTDFVGRHVSVEEVAWPQAALLVAYSDGLVERPDCDLEEQLHLLRDLVEHAVNNSEAGRNADDLADLILGRLVPDPLVALDDVCILVLRRPALAG